MLNPILPSLYSSVVLHHMSLRKGPSSILQATNMFGLYYELNKTVLRSNMNWDFNVVFFVIYAQLYITLRNIGACLQISDFTANYSFNSGDCTDKGPHMSDTQGETRQFISQSSNPEWRESGKPTIPTCVAAQCHLLWCYNSTAYIQSLLWLIFALCNAETEQKNANFNLLWSYILKIDTTKHLLNMHTLKLFTN